MGDWEPYDGGEITVETGRELALLPDPANLVLTPPVTHYLRLDERGAAERTQRRTRVEVERLKQIEAKLESERSQLRCEIESSQLWMASMKDVLSEKWRLVGKLKGEVGRLRQEREEVETEVLQMVNVLEEVYVQEERTKMELEDEKAQVERARKTVGVAEQRVQKRRRTAQMMEAERKILEAEVVAENTKLQALEDKMAELEVLAAVEAARGGLAQQKLMASAARVSLLTGKQVTAFPSQRTLMWRGRPRRRKSVGIARLCASRAWTNEEAKPVPSLQNVSAAPLEESGCTRGQTSRRPPSFAVATCGLKVQEDIQATAVSPPSQSIPAAAEPEPTPPSTDKNNNGHTLKLAPLNDSLWEQETSSTSDLCTPTSASSLQLFPPATQIAPGRPVKSTLSLGSVQGRRELVDMCSSMLEASDGSVSGLTRQSSQQDCLPSSRKDTDSSVPDPSRQFAAPQISVQELPSTLQLGKPFAPLSPPSPSFAGRESQSDGSCASLEFMGGGHWGDGDSGAHLLPMSPWERRQCQEVFAMLAGPNGAVVARGTVESVLTHPDGLAHPDVHKAWALSSGGDFAGEHQFMLFMLLIRRAYQNCELPTSLSQSEVIRLLDLQGEPPRLPLDASRPFKDMGGISTASGAPAHVAGMSVTDASVQDKDPGAEELDTIQDPSPPGWSPTMRVSPHQGEAAKWRRLRRSTSASACEWVGGSKGSLSDMCGPASREWDLSSYAAAIAAGDGIAGEKFTDAPPSEGNKSQRQGQGAEGKVGPLGMKTTHRRLSRGGSMRSTRSAWDAHDGGAEKVKQGRAGIGWGSLVRSSSSSSSMKAQKEANAKAQKSKASPRPRLASFDDKPLEEVKCAKVEPSWLTVGRGAHLKMLETVHESSESSSWRIDTMPEEGHPQKYGGAYSQGPLLSPTSSHSVLKKLASKGILLWMTGEKGKRVTPRDS